MIGSLQETNPAIAAQWHPTRNGALSPRSVKKSSRVLVWWRCKFGHEWETEIRSRTSKPSGCPVCSGKKVWAGENDLQTLRPDLAKQWHSTRNGELTPSMVTSSSHRVVWWTCSMGHDYEASVNKRQQGQGCPACSGKKVLENFNDLQSLRPDLALEWDSTKNSELSPSSVTVQSGRRVWWRDKNGHEWRATIASRASGAGCPVCSGRSVLQGENDLETLNPDLAKTWHSAKNAPLLPSQVTVASGQKVWWLGECGHEWQQQIAARGYGQGCPVCAGKIVVPGFNDLATAHPEIASQWHPSRNGNLNAQQVTFASSKKYWWLGSCGHEWFTAISSRTAGRGCPKCSVGGFSTANPAILYFIHNPKMFAFKVGVTNADNKLDRIGKFVSLGWREVKTWNDESGLKILEVETKFFQWLRKEKSVPQLLGKSELNITSGATETF